MRVFANTDVGKARDINEDFYYASDPHNPLKLYILADGMGGYNGGEIASRLATNAIKGYIESNFLETNLEDKEAILILLKNAIEYANMVVYERSKQDTELEGMGTTIEVSIIYKDRVYIGHIGDSRIYRIRKNIIRRLTQDHSYVEKLVKDGTITREEAQNHPKKNMLTRALGCTSYVEPDLMVKGFQVGDILVMCSDGLTNMVSEQEIYDYIIENIQQANRTLIQRANELGGYDNATVIILFND